MITVGVCGCGVVGSTTARMFKELTGGSIKVLEYDKFKEGKWVSIERLIKESDFLFICLPTPMKEDGAIDLEYIDVSLKLISCEHKSKLNQIIIIRSTIVPGSCDYFAKEYPNLNIAFVPEFLVESNPWREVMESDKVIIGTNSDNTFKKICSLFRSVYVFDRCNITYIQMERKEAEMYKYACNTLLAMNVLVANELYFICKSSGIDYRVIQKYLIYDSRLGTHTLVPGLDGKVGIGGKCLPKDVSALFNFAERNGFHASIVKAGLDWNEIIRENKDWLTIPGATSSCKFE